MIYADYNATTPLDPDVRAIVIEAMDAAWGNPSSIHRVGREARLRLDDARDRVAGVLQCKPGELVFTSGGTEANNLAIFGAARARRDRGRHLVCSPVEHHAVLHCFEHLARHEGFTLTLLPVDAAGRISPDDLTRSLRDDTILVSVMAANNEVGTLQPIAQLGAICRALGILFHTDAVQAFGKESISNIAAFNADLVTLCSHKLHGPKGAGALYVRSPLRLSPLLLGGSHEDERRAGTENVSSVLGLAACVEQFVRHPVFQADYLRPFTTAVRSCLATVEGVSIVTPPQGSLSNTLSFTVSDADSIGLLAALDLAGVAASSGSACSVGSLQPSHVLLAMGFDPAAASALVRLSFGRENTASEIKALCDVLPTCIARVRASR